eukprot:jgi/Bigna1/129302/aug1.8_g4010
MTTNSLAFRLRNKCLHVRAAEVDEGRRNGKDDVPKPAVIRTATTSRSSNGGDGDGGVIEADGRKSQGDMTIKSISTTTTQSTPTSSDSQQQQYLEFSEELWLGMGVGLMTGITVVLFSTTVHILQDLFSVSSSPQGHSAIKALGYEIPGVPADPLHIFPSQWNKHFFAPIFGGVISTLLLALTDKRSSSLITWSIKNERSQAAKVAAACINLGSGNSLGPEGPSVEIGKAWAKALSSSPSMLYPAIYAGMAAGVSAGFDAPVSGVLFALESASGFASSPPPSRLRSQDDLAAVVVAAAVAAVTSRIGLGEAPALFAIPQYQLGSYFELPLYAGLGLVCGFASLAFTKSEKFLSQGFGNFNRILDENLFSSSGLVEIAIAKIGTTVLARAFGLEGGVYAPSLFIGAALGLAFGLFVHPLLGGFVGDFGLLSAPQAYALAGMAATLAGICRIPLTASLILFEITRDYGIILPILVSVAVSSLQVSSRDTKEEGEKARSFTRKGLTSESSSNILPPLQHDSRRRVAILYEKQQLGDILYSNEDQQELFNFVISVTAITIAYSSNRTGIRWEEK